MKTTTMLLALAALLGATACQDRGDRQAGDRSGATSERGGKGEGGVASGPTQTTGAENTISGQVVSARAGEVVIKPQGKEQVRLLVDPGTTVMIGGKTGAATDLKEGSQVRASYDETGGSQRAIRIEVGAGGSKDGASAGGSAGGDRPASMDPGTGGFGQGVGGGRSKDAPRGDDDKKK